MKKLIVAAVCMMSLISFSRGPGGPMPIGHGPAPHHFSAWGPGGSHFWPGFVGGIVGSALYRPLPPAPIVAPYAVAAPIPAVTYAPAPVVVTQPVVQYPVVQRQVVVQQPIVQQQVVQIVTNIVEVKKN